MSTKYVIYDCTSPPAGGISDRIKGIVSCYGLAKKLQREFIINWTSPFSLETALGCNKVNWKKRPIEGTYKQYFAIDIDNFSNNLLPALGLLCFNEDIISIKTNINFLNLISTEHFSNLFNDLFTLNIQLPFLINKNTTGVCARFGGTQSNWNDSTFNRDLSFEYVYDKIKKINEPVFICTDSNKFIDFIKGKVNFISTEGITQHMDRQICTLEGFKKSFLDFFLLRQCETILSTKGDFAKTAALSNNKTVIEI